MQTRIQTDDIQPRSGFAVAEAITVCLLVTFITALSVPAVRQARDHARQWHCRQQVHVFDVSAGKASELSPLPIQSLLFSENSESTARASVPLVKSLIAAEDSSRLPAVSDSAKLNFDSGVSGDIADAVTLPLAEQAGVPYCPDHSEMTFQLNGESITLLLGEARLCGGCVP